jgi:hypothetical protein
METLTKNALYKVNTILQVHAAETCLIQVLVESGEESSALEWQSAMANVFSNTRQTSTYVNEITTSDEN